MIVIAVLVGLAIAYMDSRPTWDDTGVTAGAIALVACILAFASPNRPWLTALAVGAWVPIFGLAFGWSWASLFAIVVALVGAYFGASVRSVGVAAKA